MKDPLKEQQQAMQQFTQYVRDQTRQFTALQAQLEPVAALLARLPDVQRQVTEGEQKLADLQTQIEQARASHGEIVASLQQQRRDVQALLQQDQATRGQARQAYEQEQERWRLARAEAQVALRDVEQEILKKRAESARLTEELNATVQTVLGGRR